jgi:hypothetical protein
VYDSSKDRDSGGSGTTVVIVISVLIILVPVGFIISCIVKKLRDRQNAKDPENDRIPLPDQSQISQHSPDYNLHTNLYPFPMGDNPENMQNFMQGIA